MRAEIATPEQIIKMLKRNATAIVTPESQLQLAVIGQAVRDAAGESRDKDAREARDEAREFFLSRRSDLHAELCGLDPDFLVEMVVKHTAWGQQLRRGT